VLSCLIKPDAQGRKLVLSRHVGTITPRLWVSYVPLYAFQTDTGYYACTPERVQQLPRARLVVAKRTSSPTSNLTTPPRTVAEPSPKRAEATAGWRPL